MSTLKGYRGPAQKQGDYLEDCCSEPGKRNNVAWTMGQARKYKKKKITIK